MSSHPCTRSRMKQLWHLSSALPAEEPCGDAAFLVLLWVQAGWEVELHGVGAAVPAASSLLLLQEPQAAFQAWMLPCLVCVCVWEGETRYWAGDQARLSQSQPCSSISVCSKRALRYVAKNSTRFFSLTKQYPQLCVFSRDSFVICSEGWSCASAQP